MSARKRSDATRDLFADDVRQERTAICVESGVSLGRAEEIADRELHIAPPHRGERAMGYNPADPLRGIVHAASLDADLWWGAFNSGPWLWEDATVAQKRVCANALRASALAASALADALDPEEDT